MYANVERGVNALTTRIAVVVAVTCSFVVVTSLRPAVAQQEAGPEEQDITISGIVTANGMPAGEALEVSLLGGEDQDQDCGSTQTNANGRFTVQVTDCQEGDEYVVHLAALALSSETVYTLNPAFTNISVNFPDLTTEQLSQLGIQTEAPSTEQQQVSPLLDDESLEFILVAVIIASAIVLLALLLKASVDNNLRKQTEALVLVAVITAIIILGVAGKIGSDGLVSVLAAIVGWGAARSVPDRHAPPPPDQNLHSAGPDSGASGDTAGEFPSDVLNADTESSTSGESAEAEEESQP
jgi:hypothetical protein